MITANCEWCGKESQYQYKSWVRRFCSHLCSNNYKWTIREKMQFKTLECKRCEQSFTIPCHAKDQMFCSKMCGILYRKKAKLIPCKTCGKEFETSRQKFCSRKCATDGQKNIALGKENGFWYENGYKVLYLEGDKSRKEHIYIMEQHLGRRLVKGEVVHHINHNKLDNRLENLQLMTWTEHSRLHRKLDKEQNKPLFGRQA